MNKLIQKYRKDQLTPEELPELRKYAETATKEEIEQELYNIWTDADIDESVTEDKLAARVKERIDASLGRRKNMTSLLIQWSQIAAAVLLPLFILCTIYLYRENNLIISDEMVVTTGKAERAAITLPDGTVVSLNSESKLAYQPKEYNKKERKINFGGEGYFRVCRNEESPFSIAAKGLEVKVLGTTFNLLVRENSDVAKLTLEEGSVMLASTISHKNVILKENQQAIVNQTTGEITVLSQENAQDASAWQRGDLIFRNIPLHEVIRTLEENYHVTISVDSIENITDEFTGIIPINDLNEALEVIERSYHLKATLNGREIAMQSK